MESVKHASLEIFSIWLVKANLTKQPDFKFSPAIVRGLGDMTGVLSILKKIYMAVCFEGSRFPLISMDSCRIVTFDFSGTRTTEK